MMDNESDISSLDMEMIVYRKGSLCAHLDLNRGYLTWRDSTQWCNNFTRSLTDEQIKIIRNLIRSCQHRSFQNQSDENDKHEKWSPGDPDFEPVSWLITVQEGDKTWQVRSYGLLPDCWLPIKEEIERIGRVCFFI